jgi:hypothetical protein
MRYLPGLSNVKLFLLSGCGITHHPFYLLALFAGLETLLVGIIVSLLFSFFVMIVQIPAGCAGDRAHGQSDSGMSRDRPNNPTGCGADGSTPQGALFGKQTSLSPPGPDPAAS